MSILTKTCVVILMLLNIFAFAVFVTRRTTEANWKQGYEKEKAKIEVREMEHASAQLALQQVTAERDKYRAELNDEQHKRILDVGNLQTQLRAANSTNADLRNQLKRITANQMELQKTLDIEVRRRVEVARELDLARKENNRLKALQRGTDDALKNAQAKGERLGKVVRVLREQLAQAEERIKDLEEMLATGAGKKKPTVDDLPRIDGTITSVKEDMAGINIGSANGIKSGMKLIIYRGGQFVGYLRVQELGIREAAGTVFDKQRDPMKGDKVTTTLRE